MRVLVTWGSQRGGTEGIARVIAETLEHEGLEVDLLPPKRALEAHGFDAVIVGGALYANRWHEDARHFVARRERDLRRVPVWFFSSGPLDDSADHANIEPTRQVAILMERVGAQSHVTFGGRLEKNAKGFPASAMAKTKSGDWRNEAHIRAWAREIAHVMPEARPRPATPQRGRSPAMIIAHAALAWALSVAVTMPLLFVASPGFVLGLHVTLAPAIALFFARHYFQYRGAHEPVETALVFGALFGACDAIVFRAPLALLAAALVLAITWAVGAVMQMGPMPKHA
jgi:menaquinone-dependent protoporphyrinogen oxidase